MRIILALILVIASSTAVFADTQKTPATTTQPETANQGTVTPNSEPAPFPDVPKNHWAYEAVRQLQKAGILIGYPKGTVDGNNTMTRNDFAVAISRMLPVVCGQANSLKATRQQVDDLERRISALEKGEVAQPAKTNAPAPPELCTKAEYDSVQKLITEFSNELKKMRVDVDALKKDVAALNDRVTAVKKSKFP